MRSDCSQHPLYRAPLPKTMRWLECAGCAHQYVEGYFGPEAMALLLTDSSQKPGFELESQRFAWSQLLEKLQALKPGGRLLDVGFGSGALLTTAAEYGYDVTGLDVREDNVRVLKKFGYRVHLSDFAGFRADEPFDVLVLADVLEHLPFPGQALEQAHALLAKDGLLVLSMPNADSFLWQVLTRNGVNPYWYEIEHYHNFGRKRLAALLGQYGFEPLRYGISPRYLACMEVISRKR